MDSKAWYAFQDSIDELFKKQEKEILKTRALIDKLNKQFCETHDTLTKIYDKLEKLK